MDWKKLPINGPLSENVDDIELLAKSAALENIYIDEDGGSNSRPGGDVFNEGFGLGAPTQGKYEWVEQGWLVFVQSGQIFLKKGVDFDPENITGDALELSGSVTFAFNGTNLVMANGGRMVTTDTTGANTVFVSDADAPTEVTHVIHVDGRILCNKVETDQIYYSGIDDLSFAADDFFTAEAIPDEVLAIHVADSEVYAFGAASLEIFYSSGIADNPFVRRDVVERGISAASSVVRANNTFYWFNEERRLVFLEGATARSVSLPVDRTFHDIETFSDATGYLLIESGQYFLVFDFPTEDKSYVYDMKMDYWYRWGYWDSRGAKLQRMFFVHAVYMSAWGFTVAGSRLNDKLYKILRTAYDDGGNQKRVLNQSGQISWQTNPEMRVYKMRFGVKRGEVTLDADDLTKKPKLIYQHRDNGSEVWSNERELDLGGIGETEKFLTIRRVGRYRARQHRVYMTDAAPLVLTSIWELSTPHKS